VNLQESTSGYRKEIYSNIATSLNYDRIDFNKYDGILINMITGKELDCERLKEIRGKTSALIYFDVHTLSRASSSVGEREFNLIPDFLKWAQNLDIIQVNEFELLSLFNISDEILVAQRLFSIGVKILIITKAEKGAKIYFNESNELNFYFKLAKKIQGVSTIGCGDYFGASFFYDFLITKNQFSSLNYAVDEVEKTLENRFKCS
jgi:sugar/nucleoside kinase (ribokinase family)